MKKSLIALAVLAASGASFAQSTVTIYGKLDLFLGSVKNDDGTNSLTQNVLNDGGVGGSRWGFTGSEDLGGGLKANFKLEQGFATDAGSATAGQAFARYSYVGFSGNFGEVKLGKTGTAYDDVEGSSDGAFDSKLSPMNHIFVSQGGITIPKGNVDPRTGLNTTADVSTAYNWNPANTIYYVSPTFSGFSGAVSYSLGENKTATTDATAITAFNVQYANGPLAVQLGYQVEDINNTTVAVLPATAAYPSDTKYLRLGASYNFGVATVKGNYGKVSNVFNQDGHDAKEYQIGVDYPVSSALTLGASYAKSNDSNSDATYEQNRKGWGLAAAYSLSKRTLVYGGFNSNTFSQNNASDAKLDIVAVGVQHNF